jgi:hypothetical protein
MSKQVSFNWEKWMTLALLTVSFFLLSYIMAATVPDCPTCKDSNVSGMQMFHAIFSFLFGAGSVITCIGALMTWNDGI